MEADSWPAASTKAGKKAKLAIDSGAVGRGSNIAFDPFMSFLFIIRGLMILRGACQPPEPDYGAMMAL